MGEVEGDDLLRACTERWGRDFNIDMLTEESAELIQALCHLKRGRCGLPEVTEEIADVLILVRQFVVDWDNEEMLDLAVKRKMKRLEARVAANNPNLRSE